MKYFLQVFCWFMLCVSNPTFAAPPSNIKVTYDIYKSSIRLGQINEVYTRNKDHYTLTSTTRAVGLFALFQQGEIVIKSSGSVTEKGLQPVHFSDAREGKEGKNNRAEFDWATKKLTLFEQLKSNVMPLPDGTQDRLSAMYQFMFLSLENSASLNFNMTNGRKLDIYNYRITPNQSVTVPLGTFKALYLTSVPEGDASKTEIWLATEHNNFPYKMIVTDRDGDKLTQVLAKIDFVP